MLWHGLLEGTEQLLNPLLKRDAATMGQLAALQGRVVRIVCLRLEKTFLLWPSAQGLHLELNQDIEVDAEIQGTQEQYLRFLLQPEQRESLLFQGELTLLGDAQLVRKLQDMLMALDVDWQGALEGPLGTVPTSFLAASLNHFSRFHRAAFSTVGEDWREYLQEELTILPGAYELDQYRMQVRSLSQSTDRLQARIERLQSQLQNLSS